MTQTFRGACLASAAVFALAVSAAGGPAGAQERAVPQSQPQVQLSYAPVVKAVSPAVVNVYATRVVQQRQRATPFDDPLLREFFGGRSPFAPRERMQRSLGSGVILGEDGLIVTNNHVVEGMTDVRVSLVDQREFDADIVLTDPQSDLAVLRMRDAKGKFPVLPLARDAESEVGDLVLAVGNPYGLGQTVTQGIVSAVRRVQLGEGEQRVFLQTDAAINQGNSGGALVDMHGRLIGVNTAIFSRSGGSDGIGFAVPAPIVSLVLDAARRGDDVVRRPWIGAELQAVTRDIAEGIGAERPQGALVADIAEGSPAERAGLRPGDLVTAVDGREIEDPTALTYLITLKPIGETAVLALVRDGRQTEVRLAIENAPESVPRDERMLRGGGPFTGAQVANLSPALAEELAIRAQRGVIVLDVERGSAAQRVGLRRGDRVVALNDEPVADTSALDELNRSRLGVWKVAVERDGRMLMQIFRF